MVSLLMEGLMPNSNAAKKFFKNHLGGDYDIYVGMDEALCLGDKIMVMAAHPGTIKTIINIDLPRPRDIATIRTSVYYNELFQSIWSMLRDEVLSNKTS